MTVAASGASNNQSAGIAATDAANQAYTALRGQEPDFGFVFASASYDFGEIMRAVSQVAPRADVIGCTTAGEITERGLTKNGVAVLLVSDDGEQTREVAFANDLNVDASVAADLINRNLAEAIQTGAKRGQGRTLSVLLVDGLCGKGEDLLQAIQKTNAPWHHVVGGAAGDDGAFKATYVGGNALVNTNSAVALHIVGRRSWGLGTGQGLKPRTPEMRVTRAQDNIVYELDNRPAFEVYQEYAKKIGVQLTPQNTPEFLINNELGIFWFKHLHDARAPLAANDDGSLVCAAAVEQGSRVCIVDGQTSDLVEAARQAAEEARGHLEGREAAAVLMFDCVCRGTILKQDFDQEIRAVRDVFPNVPIAGFLTYGEIARYKGPFNSWHNTTAVIAAIPV